MKNKDLFKRVIIKIFSIILVSLSVASMYSFESKALSIYTDEYYYIASALDTNQVLDVANGSHRNGANIQLYRRNGTDAQLFKIVRSQEEGYYYIVNKGSDKVLDVAGGRTESGTNVQLYEQNFTQAQQWQFYLKDETSESVYIVSRCGKFLDACGGRSENGTNIWIYDGNNTMAQEFILIPYVNTTYQTFTLEFDDIDSWRSQIEEVQWNITSGGEWITNPSGYTYYSGRIITGINVLAWKTIEVPIQQYGPGNSYEWVEINLPYVVQYKLHTHNDEVRMWIDFSNINFWQQCECGYRDEWTWEIPWPDLTSNTDTQTTESVINSIRPQQYVMYTVY